MNIILDSFLKIINKRGKNKNKQKRLRKIFFLIFFDEIAQLIN